MSTTVINPAGSFGVRERALLFAVTAVAAVAGVRDAAFSRIDKARNREEGGYTAVELILITAAVIVVVGIAVVAIKAAVTTKSTSVGTCITGADTTQNGGCN
ncbi:hypothetical protein OG871_40225 (plasmid) [Kitasatospora sp. NBC_00374]|uniref:hypothetical protein n=1 Tax=Kitasatospora sp. NBC_00374 TaxID=2975964 RepID=UPI002F91276F